MARHCAEVTGNSASTQCGTAAAAPNPKNSLPNSLPAGKKELHRAHKNGSQSAAAETLSPRRGATTMDLIITSAHASQIGASGPLMELLLMNGAKLNLHAPGVLDTPVENHALGRKPAIDWKDDDHAVGATAAVFLCRCAVISGGNSIH
jgi:hypothetical protein